MEKIFKKSLAVMVSAALSITAFVGCLTANAADPVATDAAYTIGSVTGKAGDTVTVELKGENITDVCAHDFDVVFPEGFEIGAIEGKVAYDGSGDAFDYMVDGSTLKVVDFVNFADDIVTGDTFIWNIPVTIPDVEAGTYDVTIDVKAANYEEDWLGVAINKGTITVEDATIEPVLDESLTFMSSSASIQDSLGVSYIVRKTTVAKYARFEVVATATKYNAQRNTYVADPVVLDMTELSAFYSAAYTGIAMYELDQPISAYIKCYDADGNYVAYSNTITNTPVDLLKNVYARGSETAKKLITDMFNLGAAAQVYFSSSLPNSELAKATPINEGWDQTYATQGDLENLNIVNQLTWADNSPLTSADISVTPSLNMAATPNLTYLIRDVKGNLDISALSLTVSYDAKCPSAFAGTRSVTIKGSDLTKVSSFYTYNFTGITLADSNCVVTATLSYQGQNVLTYGYTMEAGMKTLLGGSNKNAVALAGALGKFEASARAYFGA